MTSEERVGTGGTGPGESVAAGTGLSHRVRALPDYPLGDVPEIVAELRGRGVDVLDLGAGDPDLPVPEVAVETIRTASAEPEMHGYAFQRGLPEFREAVADWMEERYGRRPDPQEEVLPLIGSKEGIAHFAFVALDSGDRVLLPDPGYAPYFGGSYLAGAERERVPLRREHDFLVPPDRIDDAGPDLRLVYLNYPNNPTGACADPGYFEEVLRRCRRRGAVLLHDNPYGEIAFDGYRPPGLLDVPGGSDGAIEFHSFSKTFNMTGWRLGWAVGDARLIRALARVKRYFDTGAFLAVQAAGAAVLRDPHEYLAENVATLGRRRDAAVEAFRTAGFQVEPPRATLYLWMPVPTDEPSEEFARRLLLETGVVLLPGAALGDGGEGYVRAALTLPEARYGEVARRLAAAT